MSTPLPVNSIVRHTSDRPEPVAAPDANAALLGAACRCPDCGGQNSAGRKFCNACGRALWEPCIACGSQVAAAEKFCGACGVNLEAALGERIAQIETAQTAAHEAEASGSLPEALKQLKSLTGLEHPRLREHAKRLAEAQSRVQGGLDRLRGNSDQLLLSARELFERHDYEQAAATLRQLPQQFRSPVMEKLLTEAEAAHQEALTLATEIKRAVAAKELFGLLDKVQRLLALKPEHQQARSLEEKLRLREQQAAQQQRDLAATAAKRQLLSFQYQDALNLLEQIPEEAKTAETDKLLAFAREATWLDSDVHDAIFQDEHRLPLVERLLKIKPDDPRAGRLASELRAHAPKPAASQNGRNGLLTASNASSDVRHSLERLDGFRRIAAKDIAQAEVFRVHPDAFHVAAGLALQGLGRATVSVNLLPPVKEGLMGRLSAIRKRPPTSAWGFDIGQTSIKALKLEQDAQTQEIRCAAVDYAEYKQPLSHPEANPHESIKEALVELAARNAIQESAVCVSFPGHELLSRFFKTPPVEFKRLEDLVKYEARNQIPFALEEFVWKYQALGEFDPKESGPRQYDIGVFAVKNPHVERRLAPCIEAGLKVDVLQNDCLALHNYLCHDYLVAGQGAVAVLDVGHDSSNLLVTDGRTIWLRTIACGGGAFTKAIVRELKLTHEKAESVKRAPATAPSVAKLYAALTPTMDLLLTEIKRSLLYYADANPGIKVTKLLAAGEGFRLHGLARYLSRGVELED